MPIELLRSLDVFSSLSEATLVALSRQLEPQTLNPGEFLFRQGDAPDGLYVLEQGRVRVAVKREDGGERLLAELGPGSIVGEMALVTGAPRGASVQSLSVSRLLQLSSEGFALLRDEHPSVLSVLDLLVQERMPSLQVAASRLFGSLNDNEIADLESAFQRQSLRGGQVLYRSGDPGDALYVVAHGRLNVYGDDPDGGQRFINRVERDEMVGEMDLATEEPRSATVMAVRDTELLRLGRADFDALVERHPRILRPVLRTVSRHLRRVTSGVSETSSPRTVVVLPMDGRRIDEPLMRHLVAGLGGSRGAMHLNAEKLDALHGAGASRLKAEDPGSLSLSDRLSRLEEQHGHVVYEADPDPSPWTERCLRQADVLLLSIHVTADTAEGPNAALFDRGDPVLDSLPRRLVLLHRSGGTEPVGTAPWLDRFKPFLHHHVALDRPEDGARLARFVLGRSLGLVLGGGGARGFAHIGALRALAEHGMPVDFVGGTSMGAIIAALHAQGCPLDEMVVQLRSGFADAGVHRAYNLPYVSLLSGKVVSRLFSEFCGERRIEDLWLPFFCISTNLTQARPVVHRRGLLWRAVRASSSLPAIFPPLPENGEVLVDGGLANNLPVDVMRSLCPGPIIACDVSPSVALQTDPDLEQYPPARAFTAEKLLRRGSLLGLPRIGAILGRTVEYNGLIRKEQMRKQADLFLTPPVEGYGVLEGEKIDEIVDAGYRHAMEQLEGFKLPD